MEKVDKVIWGIIGAGDVCEVKSAPAMYALPHSEVKMVMRRNAAKAADFAHRHGIGHWTSSLDEILNDPDINAIYIATPPGSHAEITLQAAKAGKAVYVEKPMANTYAECLDMIEACRKADVPLFVAYYRRTLPGFLKVKELIESGIIGKVRLVNIEMYQPCRPDNLAQAENNWRVQPEISGGGYFHDLASHQLDFLDFLFGPIIESTGISCNQAKLYPADDLVTATMKFENGVVGTGMWCFTTGNVSEKDNTRIVGSTGELSYNSFGSPMMIRVVSDKNGNEEFCFTHAQPIQQPLIRQIVGELCGEGISPSTGETGARTTRVLEQIT